MPSENTKRIAKNTVLLYIRMFVSMVVSLYTSRIVLNALGVEDYGTYNIVGGVVVLFSFIRNALFSGIQRFLNIEMGRDNHEGLVKVFNVSMSIHLLIALLVIIIAETIGLWFVNTQLNLPAERMHAVHWVYQFTTVSFVIGVLIAPYHASIIAYERMSFFAYISIVETGVKLIIAFAILYIGFDRLISYAALNTFFAFVFLAIYRYYCLKKFDFCFYKRIWDTELFRKLLDFSGWSLVTGVANVGKSQGVNIILNIFSGVAVNAAAGVASQMSGAINNFFFNFQLAFSPQIIKSYAANDQSYLQKLILQTSKYSYFLLFILSLPVYINAEAILQIWLKQVPEFTLQFARLSLLYILVDCISGPLWVSIQAVGKIRLYQIIISTVLLLNLPFSYLLLKKGFPPYSVHWAAIGLSLLTLIIRLFFLKKLLSFPLKIYLREVLLPIIYVSMLSIPVPLLVYNYTEGVVRLVVSILVCVIVSGAAIFVVGTKKEERKMLLDKIAALLAKFKSSSNKSA